MTVSGGTNDTVMDNTFADNGAWGILFVPYPDSNPPVLGQTCAGTGGVELAGFGCVYDPKGDALLDNTFTHNGYFANQSNADFGQIVINGGGPRNCFAGNTAPTGSVPAGLDQSQPTCNGALAQANTGGALLGQVLCDTGIGTLSRRLALSAVDGHHHGPAPVVALDARSVLGGARQRLVPGRQARLSRSTGQTEGRSDRGQVRPRAGRCRGRLRTPGKRMPATVRTCPRTAGTRWKGQTAGPEDPVMLVAEVPARPARQLLGAQDRSPVPVEDQAALAHGHGAIPSGRKVVGQVHGSAFSAEAGPVFGR